MTPGEVVVDVVALSPITPHPSSLAAAVDAFLDHAELAATTRRVYRASLAALVDGLDASLAMAELTGELVDDWFWARYAAVAPATWNRELATLRSAVAWWRAHGWLATDPTTSLARRREHPDLTRALSRAELEALWRRDDVRLRDKTLWRLLYETAARASEALNLNLEDLDLANKRARVTSKGGAIEWIHWQTGTARLLARLIAGRASGPVFLADRAPSDWSQRPAARQRYGRPLPAHHSRDGCPSPRRRAATADCRTPSGGVDGRESSGPVDV